MNYTIGPVMKTLAVLLASLIIASVVAPILHAQEATLNCVLPAEEDASYSTYLKVGDEARDASNFAQAIEQYSCAVQIRPQNPEAYRRRAKLYLDKLADYGQAINDYTALIEVAPEDAIAYNNRGWAYFKHGDYFTAIADYDQAIQIDPDLALAYNNRGVAYNYVNNPTKALADFTRAIQLDFQPQSWPYTNMGIAYQALGRLDPAVQSFKQAITEDPKFAEAYRWLGDTYLTLDQLGEALDNYRRYIELAGSSADPVVADKIKSLETPSEFTRLLPLLLIGAIILVVAIGSALPFLRTQSKKPTDPSALPANTVQPASASEVAVHPREPTSNAIVPSVTTTPAAMHQRNATPFFVLPIMAVAIGAIVFALRRGEK